MTHEYTDESITENALVAFLAIVATVLRETCTPELSSETDLTAAYDRFRYLVEVACDPGQPFPLSQADVESLKILQKGVEIHFDGPGPLIPFQ